ncbi:MAG TPA: N-acetylmuramoyl-L-alanine amidase [Candidatus Atribacteria bacterium]|nr:N-acetylmuramoyl-L-alanine amidase [Candidatus Atribacteria bacterium]HPT79255.1 N-acetylmuramoyl-L-alanine amidase [Candidatus Atribacteria bacterium]
MKICYISRKELLLAVAGLVLLAGVFAGFSVLPARQPVQMADITIVVDPGHGGIDGGTHDNKGLLEKDINLEVGLILRRYLESKGLKVVMTREEDISLEKFSTIRSSRYRRDLDARKNIVNNSGGALLVSIHVNARPKYPESRGTIVFYYPGSDAGKQLAETVSRSINNKVYKQYLNTSDARSRIMTNDFFILRESIIPGCLVELGFITNPEDKRLLQDEKFKQVMAEAIGDGIIEMLKQSHGRDPLLFRWLKTGFRD